MSVLVAIASCHRNRDFQQAQRDTWLKGLQTSDYKFFLGRPETKLQYLDEIFLDVDDSYESLPSKTQAICQWALRRDYDWVFKCDTDTVLNPGKARIEGGQDYVGGENADINVPGFPEGRIEFCSGGAGYWLSRRALTIIAESPIMEGVVAEDVFVADALSKHGIKPVFQEGYRWRPGSPILGAISYHLSSGLQKKYDPQQMYEAYRQMKENS